MNPAIDALARDLGTLSAKLNAANAGAELGNVLRQALSIAVSHGVHGEALICISEAIAQLEANTVIVHCESEDDGYEGSVP